MTLNALRVSHSISISSIPVTHDRLLFGLSSIELPASPQLRLLNVGPSEVYTIFSNSPLLCEQYLSFPCGYPLVTPGIGARD